MRTTKAFLNLSTGAMLSVASLAVGLLITPFVLRWLGNESYGAYRAATQLVGHLAVFGLGLSAAIFPSLSKALHGHPSGLAAVLREARFQYRKAAAAAIVVGLLLVVPITWLIPVSPDLRTDLRVGFAVGVLGYAFLALTPYRLLHEARQKSYLVSVFLLAQVVITGGLAVLFAWAGYGIGGQFVALTVGSSATAVLLALAAGRTPPGTVTPDTRNEIRSQIKTLHGPSFIVQMVGRAGLMTDNILVAFVAGPTAVAPFYLTQRFIQVVQDQLQGVGNSTWAGLAEIYFSGDEDLFRRRVVELSRLVAILGACSLAPLAALNHRFVSLWVGPEQYAGMAITALAAANGFFLGVFSLWGWCFTAVGKVDLMLRPMVASTLINVILSIVLVLKIGPVGALIGTAVGNLTVTSWYFPLLLRREFGFSIRALAATVALPLGFGITLVAAILGRGESFASFGWIPLLTAYPLMVATGLFVLGGLLLSRDEIARYGSWFAAAFGKAFGR